MTIYDEVTLSLREAVGLSGCPGLVGTQKLVQFLASTLPAIRYLDHPGSSRALCFACKNGLTVIRAPWDDMFALSHQVGEALRYTGAALVSALPEVHRGLARLPEEWSASAFERAWLLPRDVLWLPDEDLLEASLCSVQVITLRRREALAIG